MIICNHVVSPKVRYDYIIPALKNHYIGTDFMNDFKAVSDSVKQAISIAYSKLNENIPPESAKEKSRRGALVFDTIDQIFHQHNSDSHRTASHSSTPFHLMCIDEDERFSDCRNANKSTRRMAEFLSQEKDSGFSVLDKSNMISVLNKREQSLAEYGYEARNAKTEMVRMMDNLEKAITQVQNQVEKFMTCTQKQLEMQNSILKKETELGEKSVPLIQNRFKKLLTNTKELANPNSIKSITNMYSILQEKEKVTKQEIAALNGQMIQHSIDAFQSHIQKRQQQIEEINQLMPVLNEILEKMTGESPSPSNKGGTNGESSNRMAKFLNNVKNFFGS